MSQPLIVLTGAAGRLAATVHRTLLEAGKNVRATDRVRTVSPTPPLIKANLFHPATCRRILQDAKVLIPTAYRREPMVWRICGRVSKLVPKSLKPFVERTISVFE